MKLFLTSDIVVIKFLCALLPQETDVEQAKVFTYWASICDLNTYGIQSVWGGFSLSLIIFG